MTTPQLIRQAQRLGYTQEQIAKLSNSSQPTIARFLSSANVPDKGIANRINYRLVNFLQVVEFQGEVYCLRGVA